MADILIIDDDTEVAEAMADFLRDAGHDLKIAENGEQGIAMLQERTPDLIVLDVEMPILDGPGMALRVILIDCGLERVPVILVSGVRDLPRVAARVGTPYFLRKPCDPEALLAAVDRALRERRAPHPAAAPQGD